MNCLKLKNIERIAIIGWKIYELYFLCSDNIRFHVFFSIKHYFFLCLDFSTSLKQAKKKNKYKKAKTNDIALIMVRIYLFGKYIRYFHRIVMSLRTDMAREINCYGQFGGCTTKITM